MVDRATLLRHVLDFIKSKSSGYRFSTTELYEFLESRGIHVDKSVIGRLRWIFRDLRRAGIIIHDGQETVCRGNKQTSVTYFRIR